MARKWCAYSVFGPNEDFARELVCRHEVLGPCYGDKETSWTLSPATLLFVWRQLVERQPRCIIEFGSGLSTLVFASYAQQATRTGRIVNIISVEHDADWLGRTRERLEHRGLSAYVQSVHAPITNQELLGRVRSAYEVPLEVLVGTAANGGIDFCLIDGPPSRIGRSGCLPIVEPYLASEAFLLLDDAFRPAEQAAWREWTAHWGHSMRRTRLIPTYRRGLAVADWQFA